LEVLVNDNRAAFIQFDSQFDGKPQRIRRVQADMRGAIAALAAKSAADEPTLQTLLRIFGDLRSDLGYAGSSRAGFAGEDDMPGAGTQRGRLQPPLPLAEIAGPTARRAALALCFNELWNQAPTMLQPVGGMDAIPWAFARALGDAIQFNEEVIQLERTGDGARVISLNRSTGRQATLEAYFVICTIPLPVLKAIPADFSQPVKAAIALAAQGYFPAVKVAFETPHRWWEAGQQIYGGSHLAGRGNTQIRDPPPGVHRPQGGLGGGYTSGRRPAPRLSPLDTG